MLGSPQKTPGERVVEDEGEEEGSRYCFWILWSNIPDTISFVVSFLTSWYRYFPSSFKYFSISLSWVYSNCDKCIGKAAITKLFTKGFFLHRQGVSLICVMGLKGVEQKILVWKLPLAMHFESAVRLSNKVL